MFMSHVPAPLSDIEYWKYESPGKDETFKAWKAGHLIGIPAHHIGQTRPCLDAFTKGELTCEFPHSQFKVTFHSYLPIITDTGERIVCGIRRNQFEKACAIPVGAMIEVKRGNRITKPVVAVEKKWSEWKTCAAANPANPADIHAWLLRLWKMPMLTEWVKRHPGKAKSGPLDSSMFVKEAAPILVEPVLSAEERKRAVAPLKRWLAAENGNGNGHGKALAADGLEADPIPKAIDVKKLPPDHPVRRRLEKGGVK